MWTPDIRVREKVKTIACLIKVLVCLVVRVQDADEVYLAPSLKLGREHLQPLLDEAEDVQRRLAAMGC